MRCDVCGGHVFWDECYTRSDTTLAGHKECIARLGRSEGMHKYKFKCKYGRVIRWETDIDQKINSIICGMCGTRYDLEKSTDNRYGYKEGEGMEIKVNRKPIDKKKVASKILKQYSNKIFRGEWCTSDDITTIELIDKVYDDPGPGEIESIEIIRDYPISCLYDNGKYVETMTIEEFRQIIKAVEG